MASNHIIGAELAQFRRTFFEECSELLTALEERVGGVATAQLDVEGLNEIFRAVHSIKAGAGAFALSALVDFAHSFEYLLDLLREGRIAQTGALGEVLVQATDVLAALVEAAREDRELPDDYAFEISGRLNRLIMDVAPSTVVPHAAAVSTEPDCDVELVTWIIGFKPHPSLFRHANEPLLIIRELRRLGDVVVVCDSSKLPGLLDLDPEDAHLAWTFEITTAEPEVTIREVFEFVDQDCDLTLTLRADVTPPQPATSAAGQAPASVSVAQTGLVATDDAETDIAKRGSAGQTKSTASIRVELARVDRLVNMVGELVITQAMLAQQVADHGSGGLRHQLKQGHEDLSIYTRELQECVMAIRMQPVKSIFSRMPRLVRDIAAKLDKRVRLVTSGEQTEVDKTVIEELADPLLHMIRNAIDHGIEDPQKRLAAGKPAEGLIELSALQRGGNILITIADDGAGIDRRRLLEKGIERRIVRADAQLTGEEIDQLIFAPGFSTAEKVTDVSGRGVGMDVVRRNISNLGGRIQIQSTEGRGTRFTLVLPLTLAVLDGMLVAVGREKYILPLTSIVETIRPEQRQVRQVANGGTVVSIRGEFIRLVSLARVLNLETEAPPPWKALVVVVETENGTKLGVVVDELLGQQQVVVKSLQENFDPVLGISGATILGNGRVALILDIEQLSRMESGYGRTGDDAEEIPSADLCRPAPSNQAA